MHWWTAHSSVNFQTPTVVAQSIFVLNKHRNGYKEDANLEFVNAINLREFHVVIKQSFSNDVQNTEPLQRRKKKNLSDSDLISSE